MSYQNSAEKEEGFEASSLSVGDSGALCRNARGAAGGEDAGSARLPQGTGSGAEFWERLPPKRMLDRPHGLLKRQRAPRGPVFPRIPQASPGGGAGTEVTGGECEVRSPGRAGRSQSSHALREVVRALGQAESHGCDRSVAESRWDRDGGVNREPLSDRGQARGQDDRPHSALGPLHIVLDQRTFLGVSVDGAGVFILGRKVNGTGLGSETNDTSSHGRSAVCSRGSSLSASVSLFAQGEEGDGRL